jgi:hypothetical protein
MMPLSVEETVEVCREVYPGFVQTLVASFAKFTRNVRELWYFSTLLFPKYMEPLLQRPSAGEPPPRLPAVALWRAVEPHVRNVWRAATVQNRTRAQHWSYNVEDGSSSDSSPEHSPPRLEAMRSGTVRSTVADGVQLSEALPSAMPSSPMERRVDFRAKRLRDEAAAAEAGESRNRLLQLKGSGRVVDTLSQLPKAERLVLVAAYLASYNPTNTDLRFFGRRSGGAVRRERRRAAQVGQPSGTDDPRGDGAAARRAARSIPRRLLGPRLFPLERMLAIASALAGEQRHVTAELLSCVSTLVSMRLLARAVSTDLLEAPQFRCLLTFDQATLLGRTLRIDIGQYLHQDA